MLLPVYLYSMPVQLPCRRNIQLRHQARLGITGTLARAVTQVLVLAKVLLVLVPVSVLVQVLVQKVLVRGLVPQFC